MESEYLKDYLKMTLAEADETTKEYLNMIDDEVRNAGDII